MAKTKSDANKHGLTRGKAVLIGILAIVLLGVLYIQFGGSGEDAYVAEPVSDEPQVDETSSVAQSPVKATVADVALKEDAAYVALQFDNERWKAPELTTVVSYDPFALPPKFPQPPQPVDPLDRGAVADESTAAARAKELADAVEQLRMQLDALKERGVHVIVNQGDEYVAMIGDRMIHVGDEIEGFTVTAIGPQGVRVERKDPQ